MDTSVPAGHHRVLIYKNGVREVAIVPDDHADDHAGDLSAILGIGPVTDHTRHLIMGADGVRKVVLVPDNPAIAPSVADPAAVHPVVKAVEDIKDRILNIMADSDDDKEPELEVGQAVGGGADMQRGTHHGRRRFVSSHRV